ncbi:TMEM175 family protein [Nitrolancea hollandica]|nr:TMEM175 family protein [Nitrolancea hollandica]
MVVSCTSVVGKNHPTSLFQYDDENHFQREILRHRGKWARIIHARREQWIHRPAPKAGGMKGGEEIGQGHGFRREEGESMPEFRRLTAEEAEENTKPKRRSLNGADIEQYMHFLRRLHVDDYGEITVCPGENRKVVKRRTMAAATQLGLAIKWRESRDGNKLLVEMLGDEQERRHLALERLFFFSDGVFAISITLLSLSILDLIPTHITSPSQALGSLHQFQSLPDFRIHFLLFIISFLSIGFIWISHNHLFWYTVLEDVVSYILVINLLLLLLVVLVPFTSHLAAVFNNRDAWIMFIMNIVLIYVLIIILGELLHTNLFMSIQLSIRQHTVRFLRKLDIFSDP